MLLRWIGGLLGAYVLYAGFFYLIQRTLLYPGARLGPGASWPVASIDLADVAKVVLRTPEGSIEALYVPPEGSDAASGTDLPSEPSRADPVAAAIVFHGNAELAADLIAPFRELSRLGIAALLVEYPGFGGQPGAPTERSIMATAAAAYDWLADRADVDAERIFAVGRSLGSGPAAGLSRVRDLRALVLWSPFVSIGHLALRKYGLPPFLAKDRFDSKTALEAFDRPVLVFHGRADPVIPYSNGEIVASAADARLVSWECAHNDCPPEWSDLWDPLTEFLVEQGLTAELGAGPM